MKQKKVLTIGGATQDLFLHYDNPELINLEKNQQAKKYLLLEEGSKIDVKNINYYTGGGSTNCAVSFKRLGLEATAFFKIGNDIQGQYIINELKKEDLKIFPVVSPNLPTASSYILPTPSDRIVLAFRGANISLEEQDLPINLIKEVDAIYVTSLSGQSAKLLPIIVKIAKENNKFVAINPGTSQLKKASINYLVESLNLVDILILNATESQQLMSTLLEHNFIKPTNNSNENQQGALFEHFLTLNNNKHTLIDYFKLIESHGIKTIVVTNGSEGVYLKHNNEIYFKESIKHIKIVNTLGAGDAFGSTFVASLLQNKSIEDALLNGIINASSVISHEGAKAGLLTFEEIENLKKI